VPGHLVAQRAERHEAGAGQHERGVDLIHQQGGSVALAEGGDHLQLPGRPHVAGRVVRAAQHVGGRARLAERRLDRRRVQVVPARLVPGQWRIDDPPSVEAEPEPERRVDRRVDDDPRAGRGDGLDHLGEPGHHVRDRVHPARVHVPAQPVRGERRVRVAQRSFVRVTAVTGGERVGDRLLDRRGEVEVHLGHERRQHVGGMGAPLGARALPEPRQ
jgi:hypothetical protein